MSRTKTFAFLTLAAAGVAMSLPASAAVKWTFHSDYCVGTCNSGERVFAPSYESNGDSGNNVSTTAWANTEPGGTNNELSGANLNLYNGSGLGVTHGDDGYIDDSGSPQHSMDNQDRFDVMLFDFGGQEINLSQIDVGWRYNDGDISVLAWTGGGTPDVDGVLYSETAENLTSSGWELIGNYDVNSYSNGVYSQNINTDVSSSYWLIGAYNPVFGSCEGSDVCSYESGHYDYDFVKLLALKGNLPDEPPPPTDVPEPLSLLLLAGGLAPLAWRRRRLDQASKAC